MIFSFLSCNDFINDGETLRDSSALYLDQSLVAKDWKIIEMSPGGVDLAFVNKKTGESTGYTPQGMTAEEIFTIPAAKRRWGSIEQVEDVHSKDECGKGDLWWKWLDIQQGNLIR